MISENTKDGLLRRLEAGLYNGNGNILNGYTYDKEKGLLVEDPHEARHIQQIFDWFCEHGWGSEKIARTLNLRGIRAKSGGQWTSSTLRHILRNPVYCGQVQLENGPIEARHKGIISPEQFSRAQEMIRSRATLPPRAHDSRHLLSGLAHCGRCGRRLKSHTLVQGKDKKTVLLLSPQAQR